MTKVITISISEEADELIEKLKAQNMNVSDAFCQALLAYWKRKVRKDGTIEKMGE